VAHTLAGIGRGKRNGHAVSAFQAVEEGMQYALEGKIWFSFGG
jgi:hypothetical protein